MRAQPLRIDPEACLDAEVVARTVGGTLAVSDGPLTFHLDIRRGWLIARHAGGLPSWSNDYLLQQAGLGHTVVTDLDGHQVLSADGACRRGRPHR